MQFALGCSGAGLHFRLALPARPPAPHVVPAAPPLRTPVGLGCFPAGPGSNPPPFLQSKKKGGKPAFKRWQNSELAGVYALLAQLGAGRTEELRKEVRPLGLLCVCWACCAHAALKLHGDQATLCCGMPQDCQHEHP